MRSPSPATRHSPARTRPRRPSSPAGSSRAATCSTPPGWAPQSLTRRSQTASGSPRVHQLAVDALHSALAAAVEQVRLAPVPGRIVVAMTGGVDSAVALLKAVEAGIEPGRRDAAAVDRPDGAPTASARAARRRPCAPRATACHALGVPHLATRPARGLPADGRRRVRRAPTRPASRRTRACAATASSASRRSGRVRRPRSGRRGSPPGHYARIVQRSGTALVARGADPAKDQSYMLASVPSEILARCWFPLGEQTKAQTRAEARAAGLAAAGGAREPGGVLRRRRRSPSARRAPTAAPGRAGDIVDAAGQVLGRHTGLHRFTPGQRRGLGVAGGDAALRRSHGARAAAGSSWAAARHARARDNGPRQPGPDVRPRRPGAGQAALSPDPVWATVTAGRRRRVRARPRRAGRGSRPRADGRALRRTTRSSAPATIAYGCGRGRSRLGTA